MTYILSVDRAGRIVLPKPLREQMGLHPDSQLEVSASSDHLKLRPLDAQLSLVSEGGVLVHTGKAPGPLSDTVRQMREDRIGRQAHGIHTS